MKVPQLPTIFSGKVLLHALTVIGLTACDNSDSREDAESSGAQFPAFALGLEYMEPGLAGSLSATGVRWAKTRLEAFEWGASQPMSPDLGGTMYDWNCTDQSVLAYQQAGFVNIQSYLSPESPWASRSLLSDIMPKAEYLDDYSAWVTALIERYDADGVDDMPGIVAPIHFWVVGPEWTGFWPSGNAQDYLELLALTRTAARQANPNVSLGTIPFFLFDVFEGNEPSDAEIASRLANPTPLGRNSAEGIYDILDRPDLFDFVSVHSLGDYTEIPPTLRWFNEQMNMRGYTKPIWLDDAFPISLLANITWPLIYPLSSESQRIPVLDALRDVASLVEPDYSISKAWIEALVARGTVQKVVTALGEGATGIQLGNTEDWMHDSNTGLRTLQVNLIGAAAMMGLQEVSHTGNLYAYCDVRTPGPPRPAFSNLTDLAQRIGDGSFDQVQSHNLPSGVRGYTFTKGSTWWSAVWVEDGIFDLPGGIETPTMVTIDLPTGTTSVQATWSQIDHSPGMMQTLPVVTGSVTLSLTSTPVFLEPL